MIRVFSIILILFSLAAPLFAGEKEDFLRALLSSPIPQAGTVPDPSETTKSIPAAGQLDTGNREMAGNSPPVSPKTILKPGGQTPKAEETAAQTVLMTTARRFSETIFPLPAPSISESYGAERKILTPPGISGNLFGNKTIMGRGEAAPRTLAAFLLEANSAADAEFVRELAASYSAEAEAEGVNSDVAFAQMCLETGYLRYGGLVTPDMNNFCGLGSTGPGEAGERFTTVRLGVRAHIQHLKTYASSEPLAQELVDPRSHLVRKGSMPAIRNLAGTWAADRQYADKIGVILGKLYNFIDAGEIR
jgi:hypothetical protein